MRKDLEEVWIPMQDEVYKEYIKLESSLEGVKSEKERSRLMTEFTLKWGDKVVNKAWKLGDFLWTKYDEKF